MFPDITGRNLLKKHIILFFLACHAGSAAPAQSAAIVFEHTAPVHSGIYSSIIFKENCQRIAYQQHGKIWAFDSLRSPAFNKLDSLLQAFVPEVANGKDTTVFGTYKILSFSQDGKLNYCFYVYGLHASLDFFTWLLQATAQFPDADILYEKFDYHKYILEIKRD